MNIKNNVSNADTHAMVAADSDQCVGCGRIPGQPWDGECERCEDDFVC